MCVAHQSEFIQGCVDPLRMTPGWRRKPPTASVEFREKMRANES